MVTDRNENNEPTIYIHEEENTMCASLTGAEEVKSNLVPINTPGSTGKFDIPHHKMLYQFQSTTATYQPCKCDDHLFSQTLTPILSFLYHS